MKKWQASVQDKFEDLPHNVRNWRAALRRASQALDEVWQTAAGEHDLQDVVRHLRDSHAQEHGLRAQKGFG